MQSALTPPTAAALGLEHAAASESPSEQAVANGSTPHTAVILAQAPSADSSPPAEPSDVRPATDSTVANPITADLLAAGSTPVGPTAAIAHDSPDTSQPNEAEPTKPQISAPHDSPAQTEPAANGSPLSAQSQLDSHADAAAADEHGQDHDAAATVTNIAGQLIIDTAGARPLAKMMRLAPREAPSAVGRTEPAHGRRSKVRSPETEAQYVDRVRSLWRASVDARTIDPQHPVDPTPAEVVQDLIDSAAGESPRRSPASFSLYRSALLWHLAQHQHEHDAYRVAYEALATTKRPPGVQQQPASKRKATAKRCFVGNDLADLVNTLMEFNRRDYWGSYAQYWLQATIACGARPGEWIGASWIDRDALKVQIPNSKRKAASSTPFERLAAAPGALSVYDLPDTEPDDDDDEDSDGVGPYRTVEVNREEAVYIDLHLDAMENYISKQLSQGAESREQAFARYYEMVRRTLRKACEVAFRGQKKYSLRSARSQFAANRKADHGLSAVAGDMGHGNERTTMGNYGHRSRALPRSGVEFNADRPSELPSAAAVTAGHSEDYSGIA